MLLTLSLAETIQELQENLARGSRQCKTYESNSWQRIQRLSLSKAQLVDMSRSVAVPRQLESARYSCDLHTSHYRTPSARVSVDYNSMSYTQRRWVYPDSVRN